MPLAGSESDTVGWFQYVISGVGAILTLVIGAVWHRQDRLDDRMEVAATDLDKRLSDHVLEDERQFAKKDDMRHLYEIISRELQELKENQSRNLERLLDKIDEIRK